MKRLLFFFYLIFICQFLEAQSSNLLDILEPNQTQIHFQNTFTDTDDRNIFLRGMPYLYAGGGVAVGDINQDGLPDLFFTGNEVPSKLYLNQGNLKFKEVTKEYDIPLTNAWCTGTVMADVNGDGWLDIYILKAVNKDENDGGNLLLINQKGKKFKEQSKQFQLNLNGRFLSASFFDMDNDGDLDVYLPKYPDGSAKNSDISMDFNKVHEPQFGTDFLLENIDNQYFKDISKEAGILGENGFGISVITSDFNNDGWTDIYVGNDFIDRDYFYINNGDKTFTESLKEHFQHSSFFTMGADAADLNNDLLVDLMTLDMNPDSLSKFKLNFNFLRYELYLKTNQNYYYQNPKNTLQIQNKDGSFSDISDMNKTAFTDWSWSTLLVDLDLDGLKDIFVSNGIRKELINQDIYIQQLDSIVKSQFEGDWSKVDKPLIISYLPDQKMKNYFFKNKGNLQFENVSDSWLQNELSLSHGAAFADLDMDGDMEIITNNMNDTPYIYKNNAIENGAEFIGFYFENYAIPIGAQLILKTNQGQYLQEITNARGIQSSSQYLANFGLKHGEIPLSLRLTLQGEDKSYVFENLEKNQYQLLNINKKIIKKPFDKNISSKQSLEKIHSYLINPKIQLEYFKEQPLLWKTYQNLNPIIEVIDLNEDGLSDIIVGSYGEQALEIKIQDKKGNFDSHYINEEINYTSKIEYIDINQDGQKELIVASKEFMFKEKSDKDISFCNQYHLSFKGNNLDIEKQDLFSFDLPIQELIFQEGKLYIFDANTVFNFPKNSSCYSIDFSSNTAKKIFELEKGILNHINVFDYNNDGKQDWIVSSDYAPIYAYINVTNNDFNDIINITERHGFWSKTLNTNNGDLLALNMGENIRYNLQKEESIVLINKDFNQSTKKDLLTCIKSDGLYYPIYSYVDFIKNFPFSRKNMYGPLEYATYDLERIFPKVEINDDDLWKVNDIQSKLIKDKEIPLSFICQSTCLNDVYLDEDILIVAGNSHDYLPDVSQQDAMAIGVFNIKENDNFTIENDDIINANGLAAYQIFKANLNNKEQFIINTNNGIYILKKDE